MTLGLTQPLVKMSTRNIPGGKGGRCLRLTTSPPSRAECHEIWEPKPPGTQWATPGLLRDSFTLLPVLFLLCLTNKCPKYLLTLFVSVNKYFVLTNNLYICWLNIIEILLNARFTQYQDLSYVPGEPE